MVFVPDLMPMLMTAPGRRPNSAGGIGLDVQFLDGIGGQNCCRVTEGQACVGDTLPAVWVIAIESFVYVVVILRLEAIRCGRQGSAAGRRLPLRLGVSANFESCGRLEADRRSSGRSECR